MTAAGAERWRSLLGQLLPVRDEAALERVLAQWARPAAPQVLAFANAHAFNLAARDTAFFEDLAAADWLARDGQGMAWLLRMLGRPPGLNLNGTDLIPRLLARFASTAPNASRAFDQGGADAAPNSPLHVAGCIAIRRAPCIALLGTREPWLSRAAERVKALAPGARCVRADGFQPTARYLQLVAREAPDLVVLGMGMPQQEGLARALREAALRGPEGRPCLIVCGGAILDFLGGRFARAPRPLRALGLEWAWRLALEPRRLARRYLAGNPLFLARALRLAFSVRLARQEAAASSSVRS